MKLEKSKRREKRRQRRKNGMRISGRSIFTIVATQVKRSQKVKKEQENG